MPFLISTGLLRIDIEAIKREFEDRFACFMCFCFIGCVNCCTAEHLDFLHSSFFEGSVIPPENVYSFLDKSKRVNSTAMVLGKKLKVQAPEVFKAPMRKHKTKKELLKSARSMESLDAHGTLGRDTDGNDPETMLSTMIESDPGHNEQTSTKQKQLEFATDHIVEVIFDDVEDAHDGDENHEFVYVQQKDDDFELKKDEAGTIVFIHVQIRKIPPLTTLPYSGCAEFLSSLQTPIPFHCLVSM